MLSTKELSNSERLFVHRIRNDWSQEEAAEHWKVSVWLYRMWEIGTGEDIPSVSVGKLKDHEFCRIMRRRADMTRSKCADLVGVSNWWVTMMERGRINCDRLVDFWSKKR